MGRPTRSTRGGRSGFRDYDYFFDRIWYAFLPVPKKNKVRDMVWQLYGLDSSDFLASALDQQKTG